MSERPEVWSKKTRDSWFFGLLVASTVSTIVLMWPFVYVIGGAAVTVVVTWPLYERVLVRVRNNRAVAAVLSAVILAAIIFGPIGFLVYLFVQQAIAVVGQGLDFVNSGELTRWVTWAVEMPKDELLASYLPDWATPYIMQAVPADFDIKKLIGGPVKDGALATLNAAYGAVPSLLNSTVNAGLDALIYIGTVVSLYMEGPAIVRAMKDLSPVDDKYEDHLLEVFREFSNNMVLGALGTAAAQSVAAGVGYLICGVDRAFFYAIITGVFSFIPFVGTMAVWIPLSIMVAVNNGIVWGIGLAVWSILFTGNIDNVVRPLFMRGSTEIHPMLVFLSVFGGMAWWGLPGALIGPLVVSFFLALFTIYKQDFLPGKVVDVAPPVAPPAAPPAAPASAVVAPPVPEPPKLQPEHAAGVGGGGSDQVAKKDPA